MDDNNKVIGIAATTLVTSVFGANGETQKSIEALTNRHSVTCFDLATNKRIWPKIKQNIVHKNAPLFELGYRPDSYLNTENERFVRFLVCGKNQQILASENRESEPLWIEVKDLVPGRHILRFGYKTESDPNPCAEIIWAGVAPAPVKLVPPDTPLHELVLIGHDYYRVSEVVCRTNSVSEIIKPKKRLIYPLKKYPVFNFVPQPKTLSHAQAEIWYRKSSTLLSKSAEGFKTDLDKLNYVIDLKIKLRDVAARSLLVTQFKQEFITKHPIPTIDELLINATSSEHEIETAINLLNQQGKRHYSEFTGGMESHRVWSENGYWEFDGQKWYQNTNTI